MQSLANRTKKRPPLRSLSNSSELRNIGSSNSMGSRSYYNITPESQRKSFCPFSPEEVAKQLTFKYSNYLLEMQPFEIVQYAQGELNADSPLMKIILLNKEIAEKIPSSILSDRHLKSTKIAQRIEFWLKVAEELKELRNYECLQIVVHSLNSPMYDSNRLPEVWSYVEKYLLSQFERLKVRTVRGN